MGLKIKLNLNTFSCFLPKLEPNYASVNIPTENTDVVKSYLDNFIRIFNLWNGNEVIKLNNKVRSQPRP